MKTKLALYAFMLGCLVSSAPLARAQTTVTITAPDHAAAETRPGQTPNPAIVRVSRTGSTATALPVWIKVSGTAMLNADFSVSPHLSATIAAITIPAGAAYADAIINPSDDTATEIAETIRFDLEEETSAGVPVSYVIGANDRADLTLHDNESLPPPALISVAALSAATEGAVASVVTGAFRFSRGGDTNVAVTVAYAVSGSATSGADFAALTGSVFIPAGATFADVTVTPLDDAELEGDESVVITVSPSACVSVHPLPAGCYAFGATTTATLTIGDDEIPPVRAVVEVEAVNDAAENSGGNPAAGVFRFKRSENLDVALSVAYAVSGTATSGVDFAALSGSIAIPAGVTTVDLTVMPVDDAVFETSDTVTFTIVPSACPQLYPPSECYLVGAAGSASVTILDDEIAPTVTITADQVTNWFGLPARGHGSFVAFSTNSHIISYQVRVDGAVKHSGNTDYPTPPLAGTPFESSFALTNLAAGNRTIQVVVTDAQGNSGSSFTTLVITNIPPPPAKLEIVAIDPDAAETLPGEPPNPGRFRFTMSGNADLGFWDFGFAGTAVRNADYLITFEPWQASSSGNHFTWTMDAVVTPIDDQIVESTETVDMQMCFVIIAWIYGVGAPIGTECSSFGAIVNLHDNDATPPYPVVHVVASDADAQEVSALSGNAPNPGAFTLTRTAPATNDLLVHFTIGGSAQGGSDYSAIAGSTVIPEGATSTTVTVNPVFDPFIEGNETVTLTLRPSGDSSYLLDAGAINSATVTIRDYSPTNTPVVRIKVTDALAVEQPSISPHASFRIERSGNLAAPFTLPYTISGTASNGVDYIALPGFATFPTNTAFVNLTIIPYLDTITNEPDETVIITLQRPSPDVFPPPYLLGGSGTMIGTAAITIREDAPPTGPIDRFERARRLRFPGRYRIVPLPTLPVVAVAPAAPGQTNTATVTWAVEASSDFKTWQEIGVTEDPEEFVDVEQADAPQRFYRFRQVLPTAP